MPQLIALALPGGPDFVAELQRAWDAGDAVLPVDLRLPGPARQALFEQLRPAAVVEPSGRTELPGARPVEPGDALVMATSGTTGRPKGVVLTHESVEASARATSNALAVDPAADHWLACLPLAHVGGLSVVTRALHTGTPLTVLPHFDAGAVARSPATLTSLVVATLGRVDPTAFRRILLGGSAIPADRPANCVATYGLTETGSGVVYDGYPLAGVELRVDDGEVLV
ncbi:MAG: AMP-binding protein, partial [Acidimicrobiales bacterium]|nr:AMP-binding protein [Acidimicrobiales bacterium]